MSDERPEWLTGLEIRHEEVGSVRGVLRDALRGLLEIGAGQTLRSTKTERRWNLYAHLSDGERVLVGSAPTLAEAEGLLRQAETKAIQGREAFQSFVSQAR